MKGLSVEDLLSLDQEVARGLEIGLHDFIVRETNESVILGLGWFIAAF